LQEKAMTSYKPKFNFGLSSEIRRIKPSNHFIEFYDKYEDLEKQRLA
jgi:hypothetical protein